MTLYLHRLEGCAPRPLASYLKALGVLRLVSAQIDPEARGRWHRERFELITKLDREALERFFLTSYQPTPILSPWNGSQFKNARDKGIAPIESSLALRLKPFRLAIQEARASLAS